jgi:hypothetical protein
MLREIFTVLVMIAAPAKKLKATRTRARRAETIPPRPQPIAERIRNKGETHKALKAK